MTDTRALTVAVWLVVAVAPSGCAAQADLDGGPTTQVRELQPCRVTRVVDGDTLDCDPVGRVRLLGIDTPEAGQAPFGAMAAAALARMIPADSTISLEADVENRDQYDRALRYVWVDGRMLNWALIRSGHAVLLTYPPNVQYVDWLSTAQGAARDEDIGLWALDGFACEPAAYRRGTCR